MEELYDILARIILETEEENQKNEENDSID